MGASADWKARQRSDFPQHTSAVLRRRAKDGEFAPHYTRVFERAADELDALIDFQNDAQQAYLRAIADNRALRHALVALFNWIYTRLGKKSPELATVKAALNATKPHGQGRTILAIEVFPTSTRVEIDAAIAQQLDTHFATHAAAAVVDTPALED